jgi:hypothetical protein
MCLGKKEAQECNSNVNVCVWNNGADLIPENDFCAPRDMTEDVALIDKCVETKDAATCVDQCKWRKGKNVKPSQPDFVSGADLFGANFCHPPTDEGWKEQLPGCMKLHYQLACEES